MEELTRSEALKLFPQVIEVNKQLEWAKKELPGIPFIADAIVLNDKFLSFQKQIEEGSDEQIPHEMQILIKDVKSALKNVIIMIKIEELRYKRYSELLILLRRTTNGV